MEKARTASFVLRRRAGLASVGLGLVVALLGGWRAWAQDPVQGCTTYVDRTAAAADRELTWTLSIGTDPERCMQVRAGQSTFFNGNFQVHPLVGEGGNTPNPISNHQNGVVQFNAAGTFGFICDVHPSMKGAIRVVAAPAVPAFQPWVSLVLTMLLAGAGLVLLGRGRPGPTKPTAAT